MGKAKKPKAEAGDLLTGLSKREPLRTENPTSRPEVMRLLEELKALDSTALQQVASTASALLSASANRAEASGALWYATIQDRLQSHGVIVPPYGVTNNGPLASAWKRGTRAMQAYADDLQPKTARDAARVRSLLTSQLIDWLRYTKCPLSLKALIQNMPNIGTAMAHSFPGYRENGLLRMLLSEGLEEWN
jgi:hypothetical protein